MKVRILGSGTSTGVPVLGCSCHTCCSNDPKDQRTRASILIQNHHGHNILVDTSPELRLQLLKVQVKSLRAVLYTHMHADHTQGFDDLRAFYFHTQTPVPLYVPERYVEELKRRFFYAFEDTGYHGTSPQVNIVPFDAQKTLSIDDELIEVLELPHGNVTSFAFRFGRFAYATDFKSFSAEQVARWRGKVDTMVASGVHFRRHYTHSTIPETIELFDLLKVKRGIISHLSHDVCYEKHSGELPVGVEFAYDGMVIDL